MERAFEDPFTYLAADINEDKEVDMDDYFLLEELVSGEEDEWPLERQWVFFNQEHVDNMSENPLEDELSETVYISNLTNNAQRGFFTGILKGDLTYFEGELRQEEAEVVKRKLENTDLAVFPNPFNDRLFFNNFSGNNLRIEMFNLQGQKIWEVDTDAKRIEYSASKEDAESTYFYRIYSEGYLLKTGKLIKSRN